MHKGLYICWAGALAALLGGTGAAGAWTPATQVVIAREAARLAPPDLARQIAKHKRVYEEGVDAPFADTDASRHRQNPDGSGQLDRVVEAEVAGAVAAIQGHKPFEEIVRRLGVVSHFVADANNPLASSGADPEAGRYFVDYLRYVETAEPRFPLIFYGLEPGLDHAKTLEPLVAAALKRGRELYPLIGREYRRIDFASGQGRFDDRSTAFGVASVAFSHAVTDVALALRYIWLAAGGIDDRTNLPAGGTRLMLLPRAGHGR
jgi:hypothetical protein